MGASGYAGQHLLRALPAATAIEASGAIEEAVEGAEVVVLCAPTWEVERRLRFTREPHPLLPRVLAACRGARVRRLVHLSTTLVYGPDHAGPAQIDERTPPRPAHAFEKLKLLEEDWLRQNAGDTEVVVVRAAPGFGAGDPVFARLLALLEQGGLRLVGGGTQPRTFLAGADLGRALAAAAARGRPGATYLAGGFVASWREMLESAAHVLRVKPVIGSIPYDLAHLAAAIRELRVPVGGEVWPNLVSVDLLARPHLCDSGWTRRELVWSPQVGSFEEGLVELAAWYRSETAATSPPGR